MRVAAGVAELDAVRTELLAGTSPRPHLAFVPTMGALHEGHLSLVRLARGVADLVVMSIFVNPLQFGPNEDYARYPRTLEVDLARAADAGVDVVFTPSVAEIYPAGRQVSVNAGPIGDLLEGASRPGHFDGVLTVVLKLLNIVRPDIAVFGRKDAQQLACIRRMVLDLNLETAIVGAPIIREADGLAMSSRNRFLSPTERASARVLSSALRAAEAATTPAEALAAAERVLAESVVTGEIALDYVTVVNAATMLAVADDHTGPALAMIAAKVGTTRLIDNVEVTFPDVDDESGTDATSGDRGTAPAPRGLTVVDLESAAQELYAGSPDDFIARRKELVAQARAAKDRPLATAVAALRRPTRSAWLVNLYAREAPEELSALLDLGAALQAAQQQLSAPDLRRLSAERGTALTAATRRAVSIGQAHDYDAPESARVEVTQTLQAALADPEVAAQVRAGTLTQAQSYGGFGFAVAPEGTAGPAPAPTTEPTDDAATGSADDSTSTEDEEAARRRAADDERRQVRERAERQVEDAETELTAAAEQARRATEHADELAERVERLRTELASAEGAETAARQDARAARRVVGERERAVQDAREALAAL